MNGIDPKWGIILNIAYTVCGLIAAGTIVFVGVPPNVVEIIKTTALDISIILGVVNLSLGLWSSPKAGPMVNAQPPAFTPTIVKLILIAFLPLALLAGGGEAEAAQLKPLQLTGNLKADTKANFSSAKAAVTPSAPDNPNAVTTIDGLLSKLESIQNKVVTDVVADIQAADLDAGAVVIPATATVPAVVNDPISHACYPAAVQFLQSLPVAKATTGTLFGVQLFQKKRDFVNQLKAGLPSYLKIGCGALVGDEVQIFITMMGMVGVTVATGGITGLLPAATLLPAIPALTLP